MNSFDVIKTVRLTEKGTRQGEKFNQYTIVADRRATKPQIRHAVQELFKVKVHQDQHAERPRQIPPPTHRASGPGARLEESHCHAQGRRQDFADLSESNFKGAK